MAKGRSAPAEHGDRAGERLPEGLVVGSVEPVGAIGDADGPWSGGAIAVPYPFGRGANPAAQAAAARFHGQEVLLLVALGHQLEREALGGPGPAGQAVDAVQLVESRLELGVGAAEEADRPVVDDLRCRALGPRHDRRAAGERLEHHHPERLRPGDGVEQGAGPAQQLHLVAVADLADVLDVPAQQVPDLGLEEGDLRCLAHLGREQQGHPQPPGDPDGVVGALLRHHPPEEGQVATIAVPEREVRDVDPVVHDGGDRDVGRRGGLAVRDGDDLGRPGDVPEDADGRVVEDAVVRGHDRHVGAPGAEQRARERVVVDDVDVAELLVGGHDVGELGRALADRIRGPAGQHRADLGRGLAVGMGDQHHLVPGLDEATDEAVQHGLGAAVGGRRDRQPRGGDHADAHRRELLVDG